MSSGSYGATESPPTADRLAKFLDGSCGARDTSQDTHTHTFEPQPYPYGVGLAGGIELEAECLKGCCRHI